MIEEFFEIKYIKVDELMQRSKKEKK